MDPCADVADLGLVWHLLLAFTQEEDLIEQSSGQGRADQVRQTQSSRLGRSTLDRQCCNLRTGIRATIFDRESSLANMSTSVKAGDVTASMRRTNAPGQTAMRPTLGGNRRGQLAGFGPKSRSAWCGSATKSGAMHSGIGQSLKNWHQQDSDPKSISDRYRISTTETGRPCWT